MAPRTRMTPFARLLLFLLVFLPLAYFGAAYYNGEDPLANIKTWFNNGQTTTASTASSPATSADCAARVEALERENYQLKQELLEKSEELRRLKAGSATSDNPTRQKWGN